MTTKTIKVRVRPCNEGSYIAEGWKNYLGPYTDGEYVYHADQVKHDAYRKPYVEKVIRVQ